MLTGIRAVPIAQSGAVGLHHAKKALRGEARCPVCAKPMSMENAPKWAVTIYATDGRKIVGDGFEVHAVCAACSGDKDAGQIEATIAASLLGDDAVLIGQMGEFGTA